MLFCLKARKQVNQCYITRAECFHFRRFYFLFFLVLFDLNWNHSVLCNPGRHRSSKSSYRPSFQRSAVSISSLIPSTDIQFTFPSLSKVSGKRTIMNRPLLCFSSSALNTNLFGSYASSIGLSFHLPQQFQLCHRSKGYKIYDNRSHRLSMRWLSNSVHIDIPHPITIQDTYALYSDLSQHPRWSPWLKEVKIVDKLKRSSEWTLRAKGVTISWQAVNNIENPPNHISWESTSGLSNRGEVRFTDFETHIRMDLTISYNLPEAIAKAVGNIRIVNKFIDKTLIKDLERFRSTIMKDCNLIE